MEKSSPFYKVQIMGTDSQAKMSQGIARPNINLFVGNNVAPARWGFTFKSWHGWAITSIIKCGMESISIPELQRLHRWSLEMDK